MIKYYLRLFFIAFLFSTLAHSQEYLGFVNSNYSGITGMYLNPANIADNRMKIDVSMVGMNFAVSNNYIGLRKEALKKDKNYVPSNGNTGMFSHYPAFYDSLFQDKYLIERRNDQRKSVFLSASVAMPSFMLTLDDRSAFGYNWRVRNYINVDGIEPNLAHQIYQSLGDSLQYDQQLQNKFVSVQYMSWAEYNFTYGRVMYEKDVHFLKAGASLKLLQGLGSAYMFVENLDYMFSDEDTLFLFSTDVEYGHSTNFEWSENSFKYRFVSNPGIGLDIGAIYEWRPEVDKYKFEMDGQKDRDMNWKNKYKLRAGLSVMDLGSIKFKTGEFSNNFHADVDFWYIDTLTFDSIPVQAFDDTLFNRFNMERNKPTYRMNMPTSIIAHADYNIWKDLYINFTAMYAFQFKKNPNKVHEITTFSLTPRYDHKWFGFFMPISYNSFRNLNVGLDLRIGPLIIGTNSIASALGKVDIFGVDYHFMLKVPIPIQKIKDKDGDKISDKKDKCKTVPGVWEFMGCPDRDGDHIQDSEDECPDHPGLPEFKGCPDKDGDKIIDMKDACPDDAGLPEFNGCPDKDGDKIIDKEDACPDDPGIPLFHGCPDTDNDSIMDKDDKCPTKAGPLSNKGCPLDRVYLIDEKGTVLDTAVKDGSGNFIFKMLPKDEKALFKLETYNEPPEVKEVSIGVKGSSTVRLAKKGSDGLFRFEILKPDVTGLKKLEEEDVKAVILTKEEEEVIKKAFDNLEFETAKDVIKPGSYTSLNELAELLKKKPEWRLQISGHTDNVGNPAKNMDLSKRRAEAVMKYLVAQGVANERFIVKWYGQTKPIADNKTPQGRQKNRRVEMKIIE